VRTRSASAARHQQGRRSAVGRTRPHLQEKVKDKEEIKQVATVSANWDTTIGEIIADAMDKVGKDGTITVEEAKSIETTLDVVEGMQFDKGYLSPYFVTNAEDDGSRSRETPTSSSTRRRSATLKDLLPMLEKIAKAASPLLIIAEEVEGEALATLVVNKLRGTIQVCAVKAPASATAARPCSKTSPSSPVASASAKTSASSSRTSPRRPRPRQAHRRRQGKHHDHRRRRQERRHPGPRRIRSAARSRKPPRTTTRKSCRNAWPSWPAALPSSMSAPRPKPK
jgi:hypothetical protein